MCGLVVTLAGDEVVSIAGDPDDPFSRGHICPKAVALQDIHRDPDRLKQPVRRTRSGWETLGWEEAFEEVTTRLVSIQKEHGRDAVAFYLGNPTVHNTGTLLFAPTFLRTLNTRNRFSATSVDQLPHQLAAYLMFGHQLLLPVPDVDRTHFLLILGANPLVSNGSLMTAGGIARRLKALQRRGGQNVVVDPRRTETARRANAHYFIKPGSDVLFLLALLQTLFADRLVRPGRLAQHLVGLDRLEQLVADFPPEKVAPHTGIPADRIRRLAHQFAGAPSAVCYGRFGVSTQAFGSFCQWLINALNGVTGNLDRPGGAMFTRPAVDVVSRRRPGSFARWQSRVRGLPEVGGELPVAVLAEEILTEGPRQIKALITIAGNPVLSTPNGALLEKALSRLDFMVAVDIYINETTRHAHIILPPTTGLETSHYDLVFHMLAVRNTVRYSPPALPASPGALHDWQIFHQLRRRMCQKQGRGSPLNRLKEALTCRLTPERLLDVALRTGPYGVWGGRFLSPSGLSLRKVKRHPHGLDLGPLEPCLPERLYTPDKTIRLAPEAFVNDFGRVKEAFFSSPEPAAESFDLQLIGRRQLRDNNSWMHNAPLLVKGKNRCTVLIHPQDAAARGIVDGQRVEVRSRVGCIELPAQLSEEVMPGVVSIPHGWGHGRPGVALRVASAHPGVSVNDLTDPLHLDILSGNAAFSGLQVQVRPKVDGSPP